MKWQAFWQRHGYAPQQAQGTMPDPFEALAAEAQRQGTPTTTINCHIDNGTDYNQTKVGFSATITCPSNEKHMDMAAELAFRKAHEWVSDASQQLHIPPLAPFEEPTS